MSAGLDPRRRARAIWLAASVAVAVLIAVLTLLPEQALPKTPNGTDKIFHMLAFAALTFPTASLRPRALGGMVLLALIYGAAIEVIQPFFGRDADVADWVADATGALVGLAAGLAARRVTRPRRDDRQ